MNYYLSHDRGGGHKLKYKIRPDYHTINTNARVRVIVLSARRSNINSKRIIS